MGGITERCPVRIEQPRDRDGSFAPILIPKHERRFTGFDERMIAMYARGKSVREIQALLAGAHDLHEGAGQAALLANPVLVFLKEE